MHYYNGDGKLYMGPVWDFDYGSFLTSEQFDDGLYPNKNTHFQNANALWYCRLLQNTNVQNYIVEVWPKYRAKAAEVAEDITVIKSYLKASADTLVENLKNESDRRPMLRSSSSLRDRIEELMALRSAIYESTAHVIIDTDGKTINDIADAIFGGT